MKRITIPLILLLSFVAASAKTRSCGEIRACSVHSEILGTDVPYNVYLPAGFDCCRQEAYPIVYLLHGLSDDHTAWDVRGHVKDVADKAIASMAAEEMVIVMPCAGGPDVHNTLNGYFNVPERRYEDFFFRELIPTAEVRFNAGGEKSRRAVMGLSMGGGGSTVYCQRHPDMFSSCYAMSPWLDNQADEVGQAGSSDKLAVVCQSVHDHSAIDFVEKADEATLAKLRGVRWFIDCGDDDFLLHLSMKFYSDMRERKVPAELRVRDGAHRWNYWNTALTTALPFAFPGKTSFSDAFVTITDAVPDAILEIRYFSTYNFIGDRIDGYLEPTALLTKEAAAALKEVSDDLLAQGYRLKIYDAYRPQCAVDHFVRWASDLSDTRMKQYFYPDLDKSVLFEQEYIMERSGHTRGSTVDLTLFDMKEEKDVDMGGPFDWFGPESHPDFCGNPETGEYTGDNSKSPEGLRITPEQFANRMILRRAMVRHGFKTIDSEWWHFTLSNEPYKDTYFNHPVEQLK